MRLALFLLAAAACAFGQTTFVRAVVRGTTVPMSCTITGQLFIDTDATVGQNLYVCNGSTFNQYTGTGGEGSGNLTIKTGTGNPNTGMETCTDPNGGTVATVYFDQTGNEWWDCIGTDEWKLRVITSGSGDALITLDDQASTPAAPGAGFTNLYTISGRLATRTNGGSEVLYAPHSPQYLTGAADALLSNEINVGGDDVVPVGNGTTVEAKTLPNCPDSGGNHLNYTQSSNSFSCGTSSSGGGGGTDYTTTYSNQWDFSWGNTSHTWEGWNAVSGLSGGGGTVTWRASEANYPGIVRINTSSASNSDSLLYQKIGDYTDNIILPASSFSHIALIRANGTQPDGNSTIRVGLWGQSALQPTDGLYFEKLTGDSSWFGVCRSGGSETRTSAVASVTNGWIALEVYRFDGSTIRFRAASALSGLSAATPQSCTTNIPTATLFGNFLLLNNTGAARSMDVDFVQQRITGISR